LPPAVPPEKNYHPPEGEAVQRTKEKTRMKNLRNPVRLALGLLIASTLVHADSPPMSRYMDCARAMGVAINENFAVVPGERSGDKGLFVYTDRHAFFLQLGAPQAVDREAQEYFLRTNIAAVGDIFLNFRDKSPGGQSKVNPAIGYQMVTPPKSLLNTYRYVSAIDSPVDKAKDALVKRLVEKIATVKEFIDDKNYLSTPAQAKIAFEQDRIIYRAKLERCRLDGDRELNLAVADEVQKLDTGFPGKTLWEIQVGGRGASGQVR
jgi:hypothetical protein